MEKISMAAFMTTSALSLVIAAAAATGLMPSGSWVLPAVIVWACVHVGLGFGLGKKAQGH